MKTRKGFVSNSSSASYYVTIKDTRRAVFDELREDCYWPWLDNERLRSHIRDYIDARKRTLSRLEQGQEVFLIQTEEEVKKGIELAEKELEAVDGAATIKASDEQIKIALKYNHIKLEEQGEQTLLTGDTIMHNNYVEGMTDMLKDIVLHYIFERPHKINLKVEFHGRE